MIHVLSALLALAAPEASGPAPDVSHGSAVLVAPPGDDAMAELIFRSAAELTAAGYRTRISPCAPRLQPGCPSPDGADTVPLLAVISFERIGAALVTELQILDGRGVRLRRRIGGEPGDDPATVAVHIVELLRASLLRATHDEPGPARESPDIEPPPRPRPRLVMEPPAAPVSPPAVSVTPPPAERQWHAWFALGAAMWQSTGGVGPAFGPVMDARLGIGRWMLGLEVNILPTAPQLSTGSAAAAVQQQLAVLQVARLFRLGPRLQLDAAVGAGLYHVSVDGQASAPVGTVRSGSESMFAAAVVAGGDLACNVGGSLALFAGVRAMMAQPSVGIAALGVQLATAGWPSLGVLAGARLEL